MTEETIDQAPVAVDTDVTAEDTDEFVQTEAEEGEEQEQEEVDDSEEIDYEGAKYKVPKVLKEAFLRNADYTRKTQELSAEKKSFIQQQQEATENIQRQRQHIQDYAQIHALDAQLQQFQNVDWTKMIDSDPVEAMKLDRQYRSLQEMRQGIAHRIQQTEAQEAFERQRSTAKLIEEGQAALKRDIPNWSEDTKNAIRNHAISAGFTEEEVAQVYDPRYVKVLHKAMLYDQMMKKASAKPKQEEVKPISVVKSVKDGYVKDPDKMTTDEWVKWRNKQLKRRVGGQ